MTEPTASHYCPHCGTEYFGPGECDWCPGQPRWPFAAQEGAPLVVHEEEA